MSYGITLQKWTGTTNKLGGQSAGGGYYQKTDLSAFSNINATTGVYINRSKMYNSSLIENPDNGVIVGIAFQPVVE
jgi:hypothetical protein